MSKASTQLIAQAKAAEQRGELDEAVRLYVQAGELEEAVRTYLASNQFGKAGRLLFRAIGLPMDRLGEANAEQRKLALRAGICLAKAGETQNAAAVFLAAGDSKRAIETLERAGDTVGAARLRAQAEGHTDTRVTQVSGQVAAAKYATGLRLEQQGDLSAALAAYIQSKAFGDAGRLARKLGRPAEAGQFFEEGGLYYEAAVCWNELKDQRRCLDSLVRVPRDHARYRGCVVKAIEIGQQLGEVGFELDQFVGRFVSTGPENAQEIEALMQLARLYEKGGFLDNARECYRKIVAVAPQHAAAQRLTELERAAKSSAMVYEKIVREDGAFRGDMPKRRGAPGSEPAALPDLPDLPDLPPLPGAPRVAPQAAPAMGVARTELGLAPQGPASTPLPAHTPPQPLATRATPAPVAGPAAAPSSVPAAAPAGPALFAAASAVDATHTSAPAAQAFQQPPSTGVQAVPAGHHEPTGPRAKQDMGPLELVPGTLIAERYRLEKQIGQGGTAVVFRATDLELEEEVAIKVFTVVVDDPDMIRRFKQELSVTRQLSHPNIVRLHDIGTHRGFRFLSMEILQGTDLASVLEKGPLSMLKSLDYLVQACSGLALAHERGIVHRDIKPENFFVTTEGVLKVMDFGIAKKNQAQKLTQAGFIAGTPPYMSPEQINGFGSVTHLADIYSLGIVAYELFAGTVPFMHQDMMPLLMMHMSQAPKPPIERNPRIPKPLNALILKTLEKNPAARVQSMQAFAKELLRVRPLVESVDWR